MLVTFTCKAHENVTYFGDIAQQLLTMMGQSGTVPSAIMADDVPEALASLKRAMGGLSTKNFEQSSTDDRGEQSVSLAHRALPLIALLEDAVKKGCNVMWK